MPCTEVTIAQKMEVGEFYENIKWGRIFCKKPEAISQTYKQRR